MADSRGLHSSPAGVRIGDSKKRLGDMVAALAAKLGIAPKNCKCEARRLWLNSIHEMALNWITRK